MESNFGSNQNLADHSTKQSRSIFVGNIPYDASENHIKDILSSAGRIINFRLLTDRETGRSKGYGFCEYESIEIAQSALRNLSTVSYNGRPLRIGPAAAGETNQTSKTHNQTIQTNNINTTNNNSNNNNNQFVHQTNPMQFSIPNFPNNSMQNLTLNQNITNSKIPFNIPNNNNNNNQENSISSLSSINHPIQNQSSNNENLVFNTQNQNHIPPSLTLSNNNFIQNLQIKSEDIPLEISKKLVTISPEFLHQFIGQTKNLLKNDPNQARQILIDYPHLAYALLQSLILTGLIDPSQAIKMIRSYPDPNKHPNIALNNLQTSDQSSKNINETFFDNKTHEDLLKRYQNGNNMQNNQIQSSQLFHNDQNQSNQINATQDDKNINNKLMNNIASTSQSSSNQFTNAIDDEKAELIKQVMNLTNDQINLLPAEQRESVIMLKKQFFGNDFI